MKIDQEVYYGDKKKVFNAEDGVGEYHGKSVETKTNKEEDEKR